MMKKTFYISTLMVLFLMSCTTTYLQNSTNVSKTKKKYDKILVVSRSKDKTARIRFENKVATDLVLKGVKAESAVDVIRTESFSEELSESEVENLRAQLVNEGFSGVLITNLINVDQHTDVVPGGSSTTYYPARYGRFGRYYSYYPAAHWEPDHIETGIDYTLESCLYDITVDQTENLQWVGRFKVRNPDNLIKTIEQYSTELTEALMEQSIQ
jgi:hypothetical protein